MPQKTAAKKALRSSKKRQYRNIEIKNKLKEVIKKAKAALEDAKDGKKIEKLLKEAIKTIDRAAQKKIIKKNTAARKKSRLYKKLRATKKK